MNRSSRDTLKSVKVDNWGQFFLQKLLSFFNKTDYCDLTLQFLDNSQLKVHRLVLSACTDYFNMLEQSCEMIEDILMMPSDLQADVIVPIVNFMYTGTLEFHYSMYEKLLKTSREMNMTVLSKLLEAHRQTSTTFPKTAQQPVLLNKNAAVRAQPRVFHQKTLPTKTVIYKQGQTIIKHVSPTKPNIPEPIQIVTRFQSEKNTSRPSRFIVPEEIVPDAESSFERISYESKPLQTASQLKKEEENSPFESLRRGYTNNKRAATSTSEPASSSPPTKKPNLDDIKAEAEAQSQRSAIITTDKVGPQSENEEEASDDDYDGDQFFDDDGSDDETLKNAKNSPSTVIKQTTKQITVSDTSGGNIDHAKILGEVLKKYPNLVKNPKNIKLKIMQKPSQSNSQQTTAIVRVLRQEPATGKMITSTPQQRQPAANQPKKIDAKTMHELIKMGAENMKGPWLCLECGSNGKPISIPTYKKFRAHLINIHKQKIDPRICEHCGLKPAKRIELIQHQLIAHNVNPPADVQLFRCTTKGCVFVTQKEDLLMTHKREVHKEFQQKCRYCSKVFNKEFLLHAHMRAVHRHMAKTDGVMEFSEDEEYEPAGANKGSENKTDGKKIEILSNIEITPAEGIVLETATVSQPSSEAESLNTVATGITTSLTLVDNIEDQYNIEQQLAQVHGEYEEEVKKNEPTGLIARLVTEDGTEMVLTPEQKEEILQQLQQQGATLSSDNVVMVLDQGKLNVEDQQMVVFTEAQQATSQPALIDTSAAVTAITTTEVTTVSDMNVIKPEEIEKAEIVFQDDEEEAAEAVQADEGKDLSQEAEDAQKSRSKLISELEDDWSEVGNSQEYSDADKNNATEEEPASQQQEEEEEEATEQASAKQPEEVVEGDATEAGAVAVTANAEIKDILNDWNDVDMDVNKSKNSPVVESKDSEEVCEEEKDEKPKETTAGQETEEDEEEEEEEEERGESMVDDKDISTDDLEKDTGSGFESKNEKSKIITELLDEWNDL